MRPLAILASLAGALTTGAGVAPVDEVSPTLAAGGRVWWRGDRAPIRWTPADSALAPDLQWRAGASGLEWSEVAIEGQGEAQAIRLTVARLDPKRIRLGLELSMTALGRPAWEVGRVGDSTVIALNAGMFVDALPWGWVVANGAERLAPGRGPLSSALAMTRAGELIWRDGDRLEDLRARTDLAFAFQSYPTLLIGDGEVPLALRAGATAIDLGHRDARLALGIDRDGRLLVALTRFAVGIPGADRIPVGLTVPEMAAVMGAIGARQAMLLDGGLSAQLAIRDGDGRIQRWPSLRRVPLALVGRTGAAGGR